MAFHTSVRALLDTYSRCVAMLNVHGSSSPATRDPGTDGNSQALRQTLRADRDSVYQAYTSRLDQTGSKLAQGDARAQSTLERIVRQLRAVIASLGGRNMPAAPPPLLNYDALRTLSQSSCLEAIQAMDALSERLRSESNGGAAGAGARSGGRNRGTRTGKRADEAREARGCGRPGQAERAERAERTGRTGRTGETGRDNNGRAGAAHNKRLHHLTDPALPVAAAAKSELHRDGSRKPEPEPQRQGKKVRKRQARGIHDQERSPDGKDLDEKKRRSKKKEKGEEQEKEREKEEKGKEGKGKEEKGKEGKGKGKEERGEKEKKQIGTVPGSEPRLGLQLRPKEKSREKKRLPPPEERLFSKNNNKNSNDSSLGQTRTRQQDKHVSLLSMSSGSTKIGEIPPWKWPALGHSVQPAYPVRPFQTAVSEKPKRRLWGLLKTEKRENGEGSQDI